MKKPLLFILFALCALAARAQHAPMTFAGPSRFGVEAFDAWQDNASDTLLLTMTSETEADLSLPTLTYDAMGMTIPGFTIHGLQFSYDQTAQVATFPEQTYQESVTTAEGKEKVIKGSSFSAEYSHTTQSLTMTTRLVYGNMPVTVTYTINASYVATEASIAAINVDDTSAAAIYNIDGQRISHPAPHQVYVVDGRKVIRR